MPRTPDERLRQAGARLEQVADAQPLRQPRQPRETTGRTACKRSARCGDGRRVGAVASDAGPARRGPSPGVCRSSEPECCTSIIVGY